MWSEEQLKCWVGVITQESSAVDESVLGPEKKILMHVPPLLHSCLHSVTHSIDVSWQATSQKVPMGCCFSPKEKHWNFLPYSWLVSLTQWAQAEENSGRWWRTGNPGMLQSMGLQRIEHDWVIKLTGIGLHANCVKRSILCWLLWTMIFIWLLLCISI